MTSDLSLWIVELAGARISTTLYIFETEDEAKQFMASRSVQHVLRKNPDTVLFIWNLYGNPMPIEQQRKVE